MSRDARKTESPLTPAGFFGLVRSGGHRYTSVGNPVAPAKEVADVIRSISTGVACLTMACLAPLACSPPSADAPMRIEGAWARATAASEGNSAAYMTLRNTGTRPRRLVGARCDSARAAQLHRTTIDDSGLARMGEVEGVEIPASGDLVLEPGGYHLMLMGVGPVAEGDTVEITLRFQDGDSVEVRAPVRPL
jgi:copper(I)-binding protein